MPAPDPWGEILGDNTVTAALLDRLLHRSMVINLDGDSYRLRDHQATAENLRRTGSPYDRHRSRVGTLGECR
ncbi:hypothetical protein GCM10011591_39260 [Nocardia camponoti]|uniref:IstB-like ATP-binding domain-containing protein n=1 Tax=Nocardia camponoti TaxID=1616106 RepID=A0A917VCM6_9NOCA|nr:hypothetical protein GCM10011591_39260 [Nocardia camponoti]